MRSLIPTWFVVAFLGTGLLSANETPHRNVVLIVADDLGKQLGCYGDQQAITPHIDRLANEGTRFTRAACTTASCSASRSVILTGLHNHAIGHYGHSHGYNHFSTYESVPTLPVMLKEAGYRTCSIGKLHVAPETVYQFDHYANERTQGHRNGVRMAQNAADWIRETAEQPFFLYWCSTDPHRGGGSDNFANFPEEPNRYPEIESRVFNPDELRIPPWLPDTPAARAEWAAYYRAIHRFDQGVGALMAALEETGHRDDTLVIFLSDNGPPFPGAKTNLYEPGMSLPLIVRDPFASEKLPHSAARVTWADLTPTILDWCGVTPQPRPPIQPMENNGQPLRGKPAPVTFHGRSFLSALRPNGDADFQQAFASHTFHEITMYYPMRVYIDGDFKLIFNIAHQLPYPFASDLYASPTWQDVLESNRSQYGQRPTQSYLRRPRFELYNLADDPGELQNLAENPAHKQRLEHMQSRMRQWQRDTNDPWVTKWEYE